MEEIKTLLKSLEKEGLYEGKVLFEESEYLFLDGLVSVNSAIDMKGLSQGKKEVRLKQMREKHTWQEARVVDTIEAYDKYLDMYPGGEFAEPARDRVNFLEEDLNAWQQTQDVDTVSAYDFYLRDYPEGQYIDAASDRSEFLKEADAAWKSAQNINTIKGYKLFIDKYPDCNLTNSARKSIKSLEDENIAWTEAEKKNTIDAYNAYLENYPAGLSRDKATKNIQILEEEKRKAEQRLREERNAWKEAEASDTIDSYQSYLDKYEHGQFVAAAVERIKCLEKDNTAWQLACQKNTITSYNRYIRKYPGGKYIETASRNLEILKEQEQQGKSKKDTRILNVTVSVSVSIIAAVIIFIIYPGKEPDLVPGVKESPETSMEEVIPGNEHPNDKGDETINKAEQTVIKKEEEKKIEEEKVIDIEMEYARNFAIAKNAFHKGGADSFALKHVIEARKLQVTEEVIALEKKIRDRIKKNKLKTLPKIKFTNLPAGLRPQYLEILKSIIIPDLEAGLVIKGQISIILEVDHRGKITIQDFDDKYLTVTPYKHITSIKNRIYQEIASISLPPPTDTMEKPVIVYPWRLTYRIGTYKTKIILTKLF
jgi:hypothetical protein